jgi:hypothetical protein
MPPPLPISRTYPLTSSSSRRYTLLLSTSLGGGTSLDPPSLLLSLDDHARDLPSSDLPSSDLPSSDLPSSDLPPPEEEGAPAAPPGLDSGHFSASFTANYVEEIARKTGSYKKFATFAGMLAKALEGGGKAREGGSALSLDVLTPGELKALSGGGGGGAGAGKGAQGGKRYVILTYVSEYDRVHYPLPLKEKEMGGEAWRRR